MIMGIRDRQIIDRKIIDRKMGKDRFFFQRTSPGNPQMISFRRVKELNHLTLAGFCPCRAVRLRRPQHRTCSSPRKSVEMGRGVWEFYIMSAVKVDSAKRIRLTVLTVVLVVP